MTGPSAAANALTLEDVAQVLFQTYCVWLENPNGCWERRVSEWDEYFISKGIHFNDMLDILFNSEQIIHSSLGLDALLSVYDAARHEEVSTKCFVDALEALSPGSSGDILQSLSPIVQSALELNETAGGKGDFLTSHPKIDVAVVGLGGAGTWWLVEHLRLKAQALLLKETKEAFEAAERDAIESLDQSSESTEWDTFVTRVDDHPESLLQPVEQEAKVIDGNYKVEPNYFRTLEEQAEKLVSQHMSKFGVKGYLERITAENLDQELLQFDPRSSAFEPTKINNVFDQWLEKAGIKDDFYNSLLDSIKMKTIQEFKQTKEYERVFFERSFTPLDNETWIAAEKEAKLAYRAALKQAKDYTKIQVRKDIRNTISDELYYAEDEFIIELEDVDILGA